MGIKLESTERGFSRGEFRDRNGNKCSIQESSANGANIWLGADDVMVVDNSDQIAELPEGYKVLARMHLTQEMVAALLPCLQRFVKEGDLCK